MCLQVAALKALIAESHGQPAETQKLIAYGKVMEDEAKTVADYKIVENGFIVMMTVKVSVFQYHKYLASSRTEEWLKRLFFKSPFFLAFRLSEMARVTLHIADSRVNFKSPYEYLVGEKASIFKTVKRVGRALHCFRASVSLHPRLSFLE